MARDRLQSPWQRVIFSLAVMFLVTFSGPFTAASAFVQITNAPPEFTSAQESDQLDVTARAAIVVDSETGRILYAKNDRQRLPEASTTKVMTALLTLERSRLSDTVNVVQDDLVGESSMGLVAGETISVEMLLYGMMLPSGNDAATALARHIGDSLPNAPGKDGVERFVALMNARAAEMGLLDTRFANPHGLDDDSHYTSARDLATITWYAFRNPEFAEIVNTRLREGSGHSLYQANRLLEQYPGADGVKTGFTNNAGLCLVFSASRNGHRLIGVVLSAPQWYDDAAQLLDYGFTVLGTSPEGPGTFGQNDAAPRVALALGAISNPGLLLADLEDRYSRASENRLGIPLGDSLLSPNLLQSLAGTLRTSLMDYRPELRTARPASGGSSEADVTSNNVNLRANQSDGRSPNSLTSVASSSASGPQSFWNIYTLLVGAMLICPIIAWFTRGSWTKSVAVRFSARPGGSASDDGGSNPIGPLPERSTLPPRATDLRDTARLAFTLAIAGRHRAALEEFVRIISVDSKFDFGGVEGFDQLAAREFITLAAAYTACGRADYAQVLFSWADERFPNQIQPLLGKKREGRLKSIRETSLSPQAHGASARPGPRSGERAHG